MSNVPGSHIWFALNISCNSESCFRRVWNKLKSKLCFLRESFRKYLRFTKLSKIGLSAQNLLADFFQFSSAITKFLFLKGRLNTRLCLCSILIFSWSLKILSLKLLCSSWDNTYILYLKIIFYYRFFSAEEKQCQNVKKS